MMIIMMSVATSDGSDAYMGQRVKRIEPTVKGVKEIRKKKKNTRFSKSFHVLNWCSPALYTWQEWRLLSFVHSSIHSGKFNNSIDIGKVQIVKVTGIQRGWLDFSFVKWPDCVPKRFAL